VESTTLQRKNIGYHCFLYCACLLGLKKFSTTKSWRKMNNCVGRGGGGGGLGSGANGGVHVSYCPLSSHHNAFVYTTTTPLMRVTCNFFPKVQSKLTENKLSSIALLFLTL
jgi:hypothetical protein